MNLRALVLLCLTVSPFAAPAPASANPLADVVKAQILPGWRAADGTHVAAVQITLDQGWKTYWRAPGDAGIPPQFDWRDSRNLSGVTITWPTPGLIDQGGMTAIGYADTLILPLTLQPDRSGRDITLSGVVDMGVCRDVCVPVRMTLSANLPRATTKPDPRIAAAMAARPLSADEAGVTGVTCAVSEADQGLHLRAEVTMPSAGGREYAVIETGNPMLWVARPDTTRSGNRLIVETDLMHVDGRAFAFDRAGVRITVLGARHAVDIQGCAAR